MAAIRRPRPSGSLEFKVSPFYISSFRTARATYKIETLPQKRRSEWMGSGASS